MTSDSIPVRVGACLCPGAPHPDGDFVYLRPKLEWRHVVAMKWDIIAIKEDAVDLPTGEIMGILSEGYVLFGIAEWNLTVPLSRETIRTHILQDVERASNVSEIADTLYGPQVLLPLARLGAKSLSSMPSNRSTSATIGSSDEPLTPSSPSLTSTSPMDSTEAITTSPDGASNS